MKKILYSLLILSAAPQLGASQFVLPAGAAKKLQEKSLLERYEKVRTDSTEAIDAADKAFDELKNVDAVTSQDEKERIERGLGFAQVMVSEAYKEVTNFKKQLDENPEVISDSAKRAEVMMNVETFESRLSKIIEKYQTLHLKEAFGG